MQQNSSNTAATNTTKKNDFTDMICEVVFRFQQDFPALQQPLFRTNPHVELIVVPMVISEPVV